MNPLSFASLVTWITLHSYPLILLGMFIEGPIITTAAGFAAGLGYLNIVILWFLSILGDFLGDTVYYYIGYWQRHRLQRHGHHFGLTERRLALFEDLLRKRPWQALAIIKTTPFLTGGLFLAGASRTPFRRYILLCVTITALKNIPLLTIGFLAGRAHDYASRTLHYSEYLVLGGVLLAVTLGYIVSRLSGHLARRVEHRLKRSLKNLETTAK